MRFPTGVCFSGEVHWLGSPTSTRTKTNALDPIDLGRVYYALLASGLRVPASLKIMPSGPGISVWASFLAHS